MCLKTNKSLFASGIAFNILVYLSATNLNKWSFRILNGKKGEGSDLSKERNKLAFNLLDLESNDRFLDNVTGDMFHFNKDINELQSYTNCGLHNKKAAEDNKIMGTKVQRNIYYEEIGINNEKNSRNNEEIIKIRKEFSSNWVCDQDIPLKFVAQNSSKWRAHAFNFKNSQRTFHVVGEAEGSPVIILFSNGNILGCQFEISFSYQTTVKFVKNFIKKNLKSKTEGKIGEKVLSIFNVESNWYESSSGAQGNYNFKRKREKKISFKHVGFCARKKPGFLIVEDNTIYKEGIKIEGEKKRLGGRIRSKTYEGLCRKRQDSQLKGEKSHKTNLSRGKKKKLISPVTIGNDLFYSKKKMNFLEIKSENPERIFFKGNFLKKSLYGKAKLKEPIGFDYLDGWVPGYKSLHRRPRIEGINRFIEEDKEEISSNIL